MAQLSDAQRTWVHRFLEITSGAAASSPTNIQGLGEQSTASPWAASRLAATAPTTIQGAKAVVATAMPAGGSVGGFGSPAVLANGESNGGSNAPTKGPATPATGGNGKGPGGPPTGGGNGSSGGGNGSGGGNAPKGTPYPGHGPTPDGSYRKPPQGPPTPVPAPANETADERVKREQANAEALRKWEELQDAEKKGRRQGERDLNRDPSHPKSTVDESAQKKKTYARFEVGPGGASTTTPVDEQGRPVGVDADGKVDPSKLHTDTELKKLQDAYLDPKNPKGKSVQDLKVAGKTAEQLHHELEKKGFKLQDPQGRLQDFNPATKKMEYKLRDGSFTTDLEVAKKKGVPQFIYVHEDGGMVRIKPEGTPGNPQRNEPNISKSVLYKVEFDRNGKVIDTSFDNEAIKVGDDGKPTAKQPTVGMKMGPDGKPLTGPDGKPIPKEPTDAGGMRKEPRGMEQEIKKTGDPVKDAEIDKKNEAIRDRNKARKKGYDDVAMEKGHVPAPTSKHPTPAGSPPIGSDRQLTPGSPPTGSTTPPAPTSGPSGGLDEKKADALVKSAQDNHKLAQNPKADSGKVRTQNLALQTDLDAVTKQLQANPALSDLRGSNAKQFYSNVKSKFGKVRAGAGGIAYIALQVADAYEIAQDVKFILDSKSVSEALGKALTVGEKHAKGMLVFGALRLVTRSNPVAIGITVFFGDMDANGRKGPRRLFAEAVAAEVNKVRPGAVERLGWMGTNDKFQDTDAEKLYEEALKQATNKLKDNVSTEMTKFGYEDGLTGSTPRDEFEVSDAEKDILSIDERWMEQVYVKGYAQGARKRSEAVKRARDTGYKAGIAGKESNLTTLWSFPEVEALRQRDFNRENKPAFDFNKVYGQYKNSYEEGYKEGKQKYGTRTLMSVEFMEGKSISGPQYVSQRLTAIAKYSAGPDVLVSKQGVWKSSAPDRIDFQIGEHAVYATMKAVGSFKVTVTFQDGGVTQQANIDVKVTAPKISVGPSDATYEVGDRVPYQAQIDRGNMGGRGALPPDEAKWTVSPEGIVKLEPMPSDMAWVAGPSGVLVTMLKVGKAKITVTNKDKSVKATTNVTVKAKAGPR
jgi:hypothetical protein